MQTGKPSGYITKLLRLTRAAFIPNKVGISSTRTPGRVCSLVSGNIVWSMCHVRHFPVLHFPVSASRIWHSFYLLWDRTRFLRHTGNFTSNWNNIIGIWETWQSLKIISLKSTKKLRIYTSCVQSSLLHGADTGSSSRLMAKDYKSSTCSASAAF